MKKERAKETKRKRDREREERINKKKNFFFSLINVSW